MKPRLVLLLATVCGIAVGNVYFPQSIAPAVAAGLHVPVGAAAGIVTATQAGYTAGLFLLVPLGDRVPYRRLLTILLTVTAGALLLAAAAPALPQLIALSLMIGTATVVAPIIGPMTAGLVPPQRRGLTTGLLLSGGTGGMLLSRTFSGYLVHWWGWRAPYVISAVLLLIFAAWLHRVLPQAPAATRPPSVAHLLVAPIRLLMRESDLRRSCLYQAAIFAGFSAAWTCMALLLTGPAYGYDARAVGLLALVNAATMLATPLAGRLTDRHGPDLANLVCAAAVVAASALLAAGAGGHLAWLVAGTLVLDVAMQSGMVANQVRVYAISDTARSRRNTAYMTCAYIGGAVGSWLGLRCYPLLGWPGVCALVGVLALIPLTHVALTRSRRMARRCAATHPETPRNSTSR
ncbi:MFS transporter [Actinoplanes sp. RD1]|uniref:MFS transporter n=1 Tax=Actinoplanes sp. RD1 TaxID=3064538 RepID=UPI00274088BB|nr:MFS transporter [Actinoplanes sp. RD1]